MLPRVLGKCHRNLSESSRPDASGLVWFVGLPVAGTRVVRNGPVRGRFLVDPRDVGVGGATFAEAKGRTQRTEGTSDGEGCTGEGDVAVPEELSPRDDDAITLLVVQRKDREQPWGFFPGQCVGFGAQCFGVGNRGSKPGAVLFVMS